MRFYCSAYLFFVRYSQCAYFSVLYSARIDSFHPQLFSIMTIMGMGNLCSGDDDSLLHDHDGGELPRLSPAWHPVAPSL